MKIGSLVTTASKQSASLYATHEEFNQWFWQGLTPHKVGWCRLQPTELALLLESDIWGSVRVSKLWVPKYCQVMWAVSAWLKTYSRV